MPLSLLNYYLKSTTLQMLIFGVPWTIFGGMAAFYVLQFCFWQMFYFYLMALKLKLQLKLENNQLNYLRFKLSNRILAQNMVRILSNFNEIHLYLIKTNKFWSIYIFTVCFGAGYIGSLYTANLFDDLDIYTLVLFIYFLMISIFSISVLLYSAIGVHNESNNSLKLINKLLFDSNEKSIAIRHRLKV